MGRERSVLQAVWGLKMHLLFFLGGQNLATFSQQAEISAHLGSKKKKKIIQLKTKV